MTDFQTCKSCDETKPLDAFERLTSGNRRGTCLACRQSATAARKRAKRAAYEASAEYQAIAAQRQRAAEEREAQRQKAEEERKAKRKRDKEAAAEAKAARLAERAAQREAKAEAQRLEREEREAALRDDIWSAMKRGRSTRALQAVKPSSQGRHSIRVKDTPGFISIAELACRHAEREACRRAAKVCKTFETAADAVRILERGTPTIERKRQMMHAWRKMPPRRPLAALQDPEEDSNETDGFDEAFGDWAPAWIQNTLAA